MPAYNLIGDHKLLYRRSDIVQVTDSRTWPPSLGTPCPDAIDESTLNLKLWRVVYIRIDS